MFFNILNIVKKNLKIVLICVICVSIVWTFPVIFLYTRNIKEVNFNNIFQPLVISFMLGISSLIVGGILYRNILKGSLLASILGLLLSNFNLFLNSIHNLFPRIRYWHLFAFILLISYIPIYLLSDKMNLYLKSLLIAFAIGFGSMSIINLVISLPTIINKVSNVSIMKNDIEKSQIDNVVDGKTNIYYLLCDEYASFKQLRENMNYENSEVYARLQNLNFNISESSMNDSEVTNVVMANCMQMDYIANNETTREELINLSSNGLFHKLLISEGYSLRGIGNTAWMGVEGSADLEIEAKSSDGETFTEIYAKQTFLAPLFQHNFDDDAKAIKSVFNEINNIKIQPNSSTFTLFYVVAPHHPYYFDKNGNENAFINSVC